MLMVCCGLVGWVGMEESPRIFSGCRRRMVIFFGFCRGGKELYLFMFYSVDLFLSPMIHVFK